MNHRPIINDALFLLLLSAALMIAVLITPAFGASADDFLVRTTGEYVALCEAPPGDPNYVAAVHFCEGFATGAYQYYRALSSGGQKIVCLSDPPPTRDAALAAFVAWVRLNPSAKPVAPVDSLFRFLAQSYPCSPRSAAAHHTAKGS